MTWEASQQRWRKMFKGHIYTVACATLGTPPTKEASVVAANRWWQDKHAGLVSESAAPDYATLAAMWQYLETDTLPDYAPPALRDMVARGERRGHDLADRVLAELDAIEDTTPRQKRPTASRETIGALAGVFHGEDIARARNGVIEARTCEGNRTLLDHFVRFVGGGLPASAITERTISGYNSELLRQTLSSSARTQRMRTARRFITWLWEHRHIDEVPRNLRSRFSYGSDAVEVEAFTFAEVKSILAGATGGVVRLYVLLMLNCAYLQTDIAELRDTDVDWVAGTITKRRVKTRKQKKVPVVTYPLWRETFELLKKYRSGSEYVLLNKRGKQLVIAKLKESGGYSHTDSMSRLIQPVLKAAGVTKSIKFFRKTGSSLMETHPVHYRFGEEFLGEAPKTIAKKHYIAMPTTQFSGAVVWLGEQLGL